MQEEPDFSEETKDEAETLQTSESDKQVEEIKSKNRTSSVQGNEKKQTTHKKTKKVDYMDKGEVDLKGGERLKIHSYFDEFLKEKYFVMNEDGLNFDDFYIMSE